MLNHNKPNTVLEAAHSVVVLTDDPGNSFSRTDEGNGWRGHALAKRFVGALVTPALLLGGCASNSLQYAGASTAATSGGYREAAVIEFKCTKSTDGKEFAAILAPLMGIAVDATIGIVSSALKQAKEGRTASWTATGTANFDQCESGKITLVRGVFDSESKLIDSGAPEATAERVLLGPNGKIVFPAFELTGDFTVASELASRSTESASGDKKLSTEIQTVDSSNPSEVGGGDNASTATTGGKRLITINNLALNYANTAAHSRGSGRKDVVVTIGIADVNPKASDDKTASAIALNLGKLKVGKKYDSIEVEGALRIPASSKNSVSTVVTETEDPSVALTALSDAFEANKDDLGTALKDAITKALEKNQLSASN